MPNIFAHPAPARLVPQSSRVSRNRFLPLPLGAAAVLSWAVWARRRVGRAPLARVCLSGPVAAGGDCLFKLRSLLRAAGRAWACAWALALAFAVAWAWAAAAWASPVGGAAGPAQGRPLPIPPYSAPVVDAARMLKPETVDGLNRRLTAFQSERGAQIAVLTAENLGGEPIFDYALRVAEKWGVGRRGADDGVLLLIARDERRAQILTGYGLEGVVTDFDAKSVIDGMIAPNMKKGDPDAAVASAVSALIDLIAQGAAPEGRFVRGRKGGRAWGVAAPMLAGLFALACALAIAAKAAAPLGRRARLVALPLCLAGMALSFAYVVSSADQAGGARPGDVLLFFFSFAFWVGLWIAASKIARAGAKKDRPASSCSPTPSADPNRFSSRSSSGARRGGSGGGFGGGGGGFGGGGASGGW